MFYNHTEFLAAQAQYQDRLQEAAHERLLQEIQPSSQHRPIQTINGWVDKLLQKAPSKYPSPLDREKPQAI